MFLRIDTDLFVNIDNIISYRLYDEGESYKLVINGNEKAPIIVFYLKNSQMDMKILGEVVAKFREITYNPDMSIFTNQQEFLNEFENGLSEVMEEKPERHIEEHIALDDPILENSGSVDKPVLGEGQEQMTIFDYTKDGEN